VRLLPAILTVLLLTASRGGFAADLDILRDARWGMDAAALDEALGAADEPLPGRWDFGRYYAERIVENVDVGGHRFRAFLQMDKANGWARSCWNGADARRPRWCSRISPTR
jgi:hypothetical protein